MKITFNLPLNESDIYGLFDLYKVVISDLYLGRPLPSAFTDENYRQLKYVYDYLYALENGGDIAKIMSTFLMNGILNNMDNIIKKGVN